MAEPVSKGTSKISQPGESEHAIGSRSGNISATPAIPEDSSEPTEGEVREARHYWGQLFVENKRCSETLNRVLTAIAKYIAENFHPNGSTDLTPIQLAAFYRAVGGNYDVLLLETPANAVAYIYQSLGCLHSLQPEPGNDGFGAPMIPALKPRGFITWQTIQLLLGPEEHVPFIQSAIAQFDIIDLETGSVYPKILPKECFPSQPDPDMVQWYEDVSERLQQENEDDRGPPSSMSSPAQKRRGGPIVEPADSSADERHEAAKYFSNPMYRDRGGRPSVVRRISRMAPRKPVEFVTNRGRAVVSSVRHMWNPHLEPSPREGRRRSWHGVSEGEDSDGIGHMDLATTRRPVLRGQNRDRVRSTSRGSLSSTASSAMDAPKPVRIHANGPRRGSRHQTTEPYHGPQPPSPHTRIIPRVAVTRTESQSVRHSRATSPSYPQGRRMSHDSPRSPEDYFPRYSNETPYGRRHSASMQGKGPSQSSSGSPPMPSEPVRSGHFAPSTGASFAAHVAHLQGSTSTLNGSGVSEERDDRPTSGRDRSERNSRERPHLDARISGNSSRHSRESGIDLPLRHTISARSARRDRDGVTPYDDRPRRSLSGEERHSRERRMRDRNRGHEREPDRDFDRHKDSDRNTRDSRDLRDDRERKPRRARFAEGTMSDAGAFEGRRHPEYT